MFFETWGFKLNYGCLFYKLNFSFVPSNTTYWLRFDVLSGLVATNVLYVRAGAVCLQVMLCRLQYYKDLKSAIGDLKILSKHNIIFSLIRLFVVVPECVGKSRLIIALTLIRIKHIFSTALRCCGIL